MATDRKRNFIKLNNRQLRFIDSYMENHNLTQAAKDAGYNRMSEASFHECGQSLLRNPLVLGEIKRRQSIIEEQAALEGRAIATASDVMQFFTDAMEGKIKDQFGLEATLGDRIKAAQELAKRTVDIDNKANGVTDAHVSITLNWEE